MDSDYDDLESVYVDSDDDGFYGGETASDDDGGDRREIAAEEEVKGYVVEDDDKDFERLASTGPENNCAVLKDSDIRERQEDDINSVSIVLSVSRDASCILLRHFNWSMSRVHEAWFSDEDRVKKVIGLLDHPVVQFPNAKKLKCGICFDSFRFRKMKSAACGHPFCKECWAGYISTSIKDGPGCLSLRCPDPSCTAFVGQDMINNLTSHEDKEKYSCYLYRSYIEDNKKIKWCPAPGCENAINFTGDDENYDVYCHCTNGFCWNCAEEAHRPVDCETVAKWTLKNNAESENMNWILANSKPCPKCRRPIQKSHGCMHMTCRSPCKHEFCWLCLGDWETHNGRTGGFYSCNGYRDGSKKRAHNKAERRREVDMNLLEKYSHYYERWASNKLSRQKALNDLEEMKNVKLAKLSEIQCLPETQLMFVIDAWQQIVECRRVLKWTYAYGYFLPKDEKAKKQLFEYMQGQAESGLERLHQCVEKELEEFLANRPSVEFTCFREKLSRLTRVTRDYFENLVKALKNGLSDVEIITATTSKTKKLKTGGVVDEADWSNWSCRSCSFYNKNQATNCEVCHQLR